MTQPLHIYLFALVVGVAAGAINTLAGSGSLITLPMLVFLGLSGPLANGTNRVGILVQNIIGMITLRRGGKLPLDGVSWYIVPTVIGAALGSLVAVQIDDETMNYVIGGVMVLMLGVVLVNPKRWIEASDTPRTRPKWWLLLVFVAIGFYGGFIQAGVGILFLVAFVAGAGFDPVAANGIKLFLTLIYTLIALPVFAMNGQVDWALGGLMAVGQGLGAWGAARFAVKSENAGLWIRRVLVIVVLVSVTKLFGLW